MLVNVNLVDLITKITSYFFNRLLIYTDKYDNYHMIFELADGGSLREHLNNHFDDLTWKDKYKLGLEITNGLEYLHGLDIIHKDLVFITNVCLLNSLNSLIQSKLITYVALSSPLVIFLSNQVLQK